MKADKRNATLEAFIYSGKNDCRQCEAFPMTKVKLYRSRL